MLWVFAALACHSSDAPENESPVDSGGDSTPTDSMPNSEPPGTDPTDTGTPPDTTDPADNDGDGFAEADGDCDDSTPDVHPGAEEACGNGHDDNCNGTADGCDWSGEYWLEGTRLSTSEEFASLGFTLAVCDANGDGVADVVTSAPFSAHGAVYVFYGPIRDGRTVYQADYTLRGTAATISAGWSLDCRGDVNGDGIADLIVGESYREGVGASPGAVYVVPGGGIGARSLADEASNTWVGSVDIDRLGYQVVAIDADGDETDELAVTAAVHDVGPDRFGVAYVFEDAGPGVQDADAAAAYVYGERGDQIEDAVGNAGDLDGDGVEELAVSGTDEIDEQLLVFDGPLVGPVAKSDADATIVGGALDDVQWSGIGHADLDADGLDDLLVGNPWRNNANGEAYAFLAPVAEDTNTVDADLRVVGDPHILCGAGSDMTSPGDVDGDGVPDLLVGASYGGTVYLLNDASSGVYLLEYGKDAQAWMREWPEEQFLLSAGATLATGDVTNDGVVDFVIGAPLYGNSYWSFGSVAIVPAFDL